MTRKELALEIAIAQCKKMNLGIESIKRIAKGLVNGAGLLKPKGKEELQRWYNDLVEEGYIS